MIDWKQYYHHPSIVTLSDLQHAMATLAKLPLVRNDDHKISTTSSIKLWPQHIDREVLSGIMKAMCNPSRSEVFKERQTSGEAARFSGLVPLVLSAFKQYNNTQYSEWDWSDPNIKHLLDPKLQELIPYITGTKIIPQFELAEIQGWVEALAAKKKLSSYWQVTKTDLPELDGYPRLLKVMLLQVWVAQPQIRNTWMILDCANLDVAPAEVLPNIDIWDGEQTNRINKTVGNKLFKESDIPWD
jgi:hypothetical protein